MRIQRAARSVNGDVVGDSAKLLWELRVDPVFDVLRNDPRYRQLLARMNL